MAKVPTQITDEAEGEPSSFFGLMMILMKQFVSVKQMTMK